MIGNISTAALTTHFQYVCSTNVLKILININVICFCS